nr:MAG TPA: hypothetical protein [Bacteriophage sp.]
MDLHIANANAVFIMFFKNGKLEFVAKLTF